MSSNLHIQLLKTIYEAEITGQGVTKEEDLVGKFKAINTEDEIKTALKSLKELEYIEEKGSYNVLYTITPKGKEHVN